MRRLIWRSLLAAWPLAVFVTTPPSAVAQMPDLRTMSGRPLPVPDLPNGTVVLRVVRQSPANPVASMNVTTTTRTVAGEARSGTGATGADGRVTFENLPLGGDFQAVVTVDGERLETTRFQVPRTGGVRVMLIAGLGAAGAAPEGHGGAPPAEGAAAQQNAFRMGAPTGTVEPTRELAAGSMELELRDGAGKPIPGRKVQLAQVRLKTAAAGEQAGREVGVLEKLTDAAGRVRFDELVTGEGAGYVAVAEHEGLRLGTQPFRMPTDSGMRGHIVALRRTTETTALQLDPRSKVILQVREDAVTVMMALYVRNTSQDIFDGGEGGLVIPLPEAAVGAQELEGSEPLDISPGQGVRLKSPIPPDSAATFVTHVRFGYVLPSEGSDEIELRQVFPIPLPDPFLLVPANSGLQLEGAGVQRLKDETDGQGDKVHAYSVPAIAASGALNVRISGVPARDFTGRTIAATLSVLLLVAGVAFAGRGGAGDKAAAERDSLAERREKLFAELVAVEQQRKAEGEPKAAASNGRLGDRRRELVTKLESVYRDLARLEDTARV